MAENRRVPIMLARPLEYELPTDLELVGIVQREGQEAIRLRFSRGRASLDLPLTREALAQLREALAALP